MTKLKQKYEKDWGMLPEQVQEWFEDAHMPKLSLEACIKLARDFQIILNRHNNDELGNSARVPASALNDVSPAEWENTKVLKFMAAANRLLAEAEELENELGGYLWENEEGEISLREIQDLLQRIGAVPIAPEPKPPSMGRPQEPWHDVARKISPLIVEALRDLGQRKKTRAADPKSLTAIIGVQFINWAFSGKKKTLAFARAIQRRVRREKRKTLTTFFERYPEAARIVIAKD